MARLFGRLLATLVLGTLAAVLVQAVVLGFLSPGTTPGGWPWLALPAMGALVFLTPGVRRGWARGFLVLMALSLCVPLSVLLYTVAQPVPGIDGPHAGAAKAGALIGTAMVTGVMAVVAGFAAALFGLFSWLLFRGAAPVSPPAPPA